MRIWILQRWQVYARICLMLAIFVSPVIFNRGTQDVFNLLKLAVLWIFGLAAVAFYVAWAAERGVWFPRFGLAFAASAFVGACLVATVASENPLLSFVGLYHRYGGLLPFALYALIMVAIVGLYWEKPVDLRDLALASAGASVLLLAYVLIQAAGQDWIAWKDSSGGPPPYPVGTMGNSNFAGGYLGIAIPLLVYAAATAKKDWARTAGFVLAGLDLLALWFTQTRGGMLAGALGLLTMVFMYRDRLPRWIDLVARVGVVVGIVLAVAILWHPGSDQPYGPLSRVETFRTGTFDVRTYYWGTAVRIFREEPIKGVGLDLYYSNYPQHRLPQDGAQLGLTITDKPHNIFLEYLANGGVLVGGAYFAMVGLALFLAFRTQRKLKDAQRFLLVAFTAMLVGYLGQGIFSIDVPPLAVMGWVAIGAIAVLAEPNLIAAREQEIVPKGRPKAKAKRPEGKLKVNRHGPTLWPVHGALTVAVLIAAFLGMQVVRADQAAKAASTIQQASAPSERVLDEYEKAIRLNPLEASYRSQAGVFCEATAVHSADAATKLVWIKRAEDLYLQAQRMQGGNVFFMMNLGRIYSIWGEIDVAMYEKADLWWGRAARHDPTDWDIQNRYALMLNSYGNAKGGDEAIRRRTIDQLEKVVAIRPEKVDAWVNMAKIHLSLGDRRAARNAVDRALKLEPQNEEARSIRASISSGT